MEDLNVVDSINGAGSWLVANQALLLSYAVNIVAALAIIIVGLIIARMISNAVNRLMISRKIDATVADFLSALVRYGIIAFTLIAALGRVGVQTASVIAVLGAAGLAVGLALQGSLSNLAAGVLLVMFRPFRAGEYRYRYPMGNLGRCSELLQRKRSLPARPAGQPERRRSAEQEILRSARMAACRSDFDDRSSGKSIPGTERDRRSVRYSFLLISRPALRVFFSPKAR